MKSTEVMSHSSAPEVSEPMRTLTVLAFPLALTACLEDEAPTPAPAPARVFVVSPSNGDEVPTELRLELGVLNFRLEPAGRVRDGAGYLTVFVDEPCLAPGQIIAPAASRLSLTGGEAFVELSLEPGVHRLCVQASDGAGKALPLTSVLELRVVEASVRVVSPSSGAGVGRRFLLELASQGIIIEPRGTARLGAGHYYLVIDDDCPPEAFPIGVAPDVVNLSGGESKLELELSAGVHELCIGLADGEDRALAPRTSLMLYVY